MFSDVANHALGVPQLAPLFGVGTGDVVCDGPQNNEDVGAEQVTGDPRDRYRFRTSPLRNVAVQPAFFHDGACTHLDGDSRNWLSVPPGLAAVLAGSPVAFQEADACWYGGGCWCAARW